MRDDGIARMLRLGLVRREGTMVRTSRRFQAAMARAALHLMRLGDTGHDLRLPIAAALLELVPSHTEEEIASLVEAMLPIETYELRGVVR